MLAQTVCTTTVIFFVTAVLCVIGCSAVAFFYAELNSVSTLSKQPLEAISYVKKKMKTPMAIHDLPSLFVVTGHERVRFRSNLIQSIHFMFSNAKPPTCWHWFRQSVESPTATCHLTGEKSQIAQCQSIRISRAIQVCSHATFPHFFFFNAIQVCRATFPQ